MAEEADRRHSGRARLRRSVSVTLKGVVHETHTINVSTGGASIELVDAPEIGTRGSIWLSLTDGPALDLLVEVRWASLLSTSGPGGHDRRQLVGLQFLSVPPEALERLTAALEAEEDYED